MSDTSRKRSRKSKLVPRECLEIDDENDTDLQTNTHGPLKIIKTESMHEDVMSPPCTDKIDFENLIDNDRKADKPPMQFSITVAVEKYDEDSTDFVIDETVHEGTSTNLQNEKVFSKTNNTQNVKIISSNERKEPNVQCLLTRDFIINRANTIINYATNIADRSLAIAVKNSLGHFTESPLNPFQTKIQKVLKQWMDWQKLDPGFKTTPLFYKCYICKDAWWYLHDFREHLKTHSQFKLDLEEYTLYESCIIAYLDCSFEVQHFHPKGDCPKCGNDASKHMKANRQTDNSYSCLISTCTMTFPTCYALKTHEYKTHNIPEMALCTFKWKKSCDICTTTFHTHISYEAHMQLMHSVRSDLVVPMTYKRCQFCKNQYLYNYMQHSCIFKGLLNCSDCFRRFPKGYAYKTHISHLESFTCKLCNVQLPKKCMEVEHLMTHTDKFIIVRKCMLCEDFRVFMTDETALEHGQVAHNCMGYYDSILLPKSCLKWQLNQDMGLPYLRDVGNNTDIIVKEEPNNPVVSLEHLNPEIIIKEEIPDTQNLDDISQNMDDSNITIKEEINDSQDYKIETEEHDLSKIFGIKIEPAEVKQEIQEESDYEDDIIRLDYSFNEQETKQENLHEMQEGEKFVSKVPKLYCCVKCGFEGRHREYKSHVKACAQNLHEDRFDSYTCTKCWKTFNSFKKYMYHLSEHGIKAMSCPVCFKQFDEIVALISHVYMHIRMKYTTAQMVSTNITTILHECKLCGTGVTKNGMFAHWEKHLVFVEPERKEVEVEETSNFNGPKRLSKDKIAKIVGCLQSPEYCTKNKPGCIICHRHFQRRNDCKRHLIEHLLSDAYSWRPTYRGLKCQICNNCLFKADDFKQHLRDHARLPVYKCELCEKTFSDSSNYAKHKKVHNINAFTCDVCKRKFNAKHSIVKHMVIHEFQNPIKCDICNKNFYMLSNYKKHMKLHSESRLTLFRCTVCGKRFPCLKDKWDHMWEIHGERKFQADCTICPERYRRYRDLKHHLKTVHCVAINFKAPKRVKHKKKPVENIIVTPQIVSIASEQETLIVYECNHD